MLTPNEFQKIVDQINDAFDKANARIDRARERSHPTEGGKGSEAR
jgi:hypothetical protein